MGFDTIYAAIYAHPKGELCKALTEALRQEKPTRGWRRRTAAKGGSIAPEELSIAYRPEGHRLAPVTRPLGG